MARLTPRFSTNRSVCEYTGQYYLPAALAYCKRAADKDDIGVQVVSRQHVLKREWAALRFGEVTVETDGKQHTFEVQLILNNLDSTAVRVELYADGVMGSAPVRLEMKRVRQLVGARGTYVYGVAVSAARPPAGYTARVIPHSDGVAIPSEYPRIRWQR